MSKEPLLETERLSLHAWRPDQIDDLVRLHGDPQVARYLSTGGLPWTVAQCEAALTHWIALYREHRMGKLRVVRKADGVLLGRAGYSFFSKTGEPEIGFALYPEYQGRGYATEAAAGLRDWLFDETGWDHFIGFADVRNDASRKVLRAIGMQETHVADFGGDPCQFHRLARPGT